MIEWRKDSCCGLRSGTETDRMTCAMSSVILTTVAGGRKGVVSAGAEALAMIFNSERRDMSVLQKNVKKKLHEISGSEKYHRGARKLTLAP